MVSIIDRSRFLDEIARNPNLISKLASMVRGEVGLGGKDRVKEIIQLESAFNRAHVRGQSLQHVLLSTGEDKSRGYYDPKTYGKAATPEQIRYFQENILKPVLAGSNEGERFLGKPPTGNASQMGFAGRKLASGQYAAGKWYGQPGGSEMFVLEAHDAPKINRLGGGTEYAGLDMANKVQFGPDGNPIWNPTTPAYGPQGTTLTSTPQQPPAPPTTAPAVEPTLANKVQTALFGQPGGTTTPGQPAQSTPLMSGLEGLAGAFKPRVDPQAAAAAATLTPASPTPTAGGTGDPAAAQALLAAIMQAKRKPNMGLTLTGGFG